MMLCLCALPIFVCEGVLGQKFQRGPAETFKKMAPGWVGVAYVSVLMTIFYLPYYMLIVAYAWHYFLASFASPLPWVASGMSPDRYLDEIVLARSASLGGSGSSHINGRLLLEVIAVWAVTALCLVKGIHSAGKAAYVTVILPVVMIGILLIACVRLEGAMDGLSYYLFPRFGMLLKPEVWGLAAGQIIFSLSPGMGTCISLASYHSKEYRGLWNDCMLVAVCNSSFSFFGGIVIFSVVGNLARSLDVPVEEVAASGEGLAFIVFAQGLAKMGGGGVIASIFSVLFFLTLFLLGLDSAFAVVETLQTCCNDWLLARNPQNRITVRGNAIRLLCISLFLLIMGLPYVTRGGYYLLEIADHYIVTYSLIFAVFLEYILIGHVYTADQMLKDIKEFTGKELPLGPVKVHLMYVAPAILGFVMFLLIVSELNGDALDDYPFWAKLFFGLLPCSCAISASAVPPLKFRLMRFLNATPLSPEGLAEALKRARSGGFRADGFSDDAHFGAGSGSAPAAEMGLSLKDNRA
eukprot:TRINITY_DN25047_c0_g1_i3.p1 TRINITY_DN25047_c0_g1~~TRINITY_DN25047_c0_g1_i3.p1  ORF type:complete len:522 (-),score=93.89 TRINITY_DN25047_c0_g1_i3:172-1737(-)